MRGGGGAERGHSCDRDHVPSQHSAGVHACAPCAHSWPVVRRDDILAVCACINQSGKHVSLSLSPSSAARREKHSL